MNIFVKSIAVLSAVLLLAACDSTGSSSSNQGGNGSNGGVTGNGPHDGSQADLTQNVGDRVFFDTDHSDLDAEAQRTLSKQAAWLKQYTKVTITVEGHCDERGTREYNLALGERRASATKKYLVGLGVASNRISTISYGKERPAVVGSDDSSWSQNRRAVSVIANQ